MTKRLTREAATALLCKRVAGLASDKTPYEFYTDGESECIALLRELAGVITERLSRSSSAIFAAQGTASSWLAALSAP